MKDTEKEIKKKIKSFLNTQKGCKFVPYCPYPYGEAGTPDIIGCYDNTMVLFEVKVFDKPPSVLQKKRMAEWDDAGAYTAVVSSVDEVKAHLKNITLLRSKT